MSLVAQGYKMYTSHKQMLMILGSIVPGLDNDTKQPDVIVELTKKFKVCEITHSNQNKVAG